MELVVGELTIKGTTTKSVDGTETTAADQLQTCVYFAIEGFQFPAFELRPERMMVRLLAKLSGASDINFKESPHFSSKYFLESDSPDDIRKVFNQTLRETFENHLGFQVIARGKQVILFKPNQTCRKQEYDSFIKAALRIFTVLQQSTIAAQNEGSTA